MRGIAVIRTVRPYPPALKHIYERITHTVFESISNKSSRRDSHRAVSRGEVTDGLAFNKAKFVKIALNTAFYVDQHAALEVFESIVTDTSRSATRQQFGIETDLTEFYFQAVANLETPELLGPHAPPYWDGADDLPNVVEIDPEVKERLRELALETGIASDLPAEWSLHDLDVGVMSELLEELEGRSERT